MNKFTFKLNSLIALSLIVLCFSCKPKDDDEPTPGDNIPTTYSFANVDIGGQVVRQLLLIDLESAMQRAKTTVVTKEELRKFFDSTNTALGLYTSLGSNKSIVGSFYKSSANSSQHAAMADSIRTWLDTIAARSGKSDALVRHDGVELSQAVAKTIMGGMMFDQAINKYLVNLVSAENENVKDGLGTTMEHNFDEVFGYFGAARDYNNYTDAQIISGYHIDSDGDQKKDTLTEINLKYFAATAAKRDVGSLNYTKELFDAFLAGRYYISNKKYAERDAQIAIIKSKWEEIIAATVVHYANDTKADIAGASADLNKHWSELKYYFEMLPLYSANKLGTEVATVRTLIGKKPADTDVAKLDQVLVKIKDAYGFTDSQIQAW